MNRNKNNGEVLQDRLMDALLSESGKDGIDEGLLADLNARIDGAEGNREQERQDANGGPARVSRRGWLLSTAAAATIALAAIFAFWPQSEELSSRGRVEEARVAGVPPSPPIERLDEQIRAQEELVEEKRKILHNIVHATGAPYFEAPPQQQDDSRVVAEVETEVVEKALESQEFADARRDYEEARAVLGRLRGGSPEPEFAGVVIGGKPITSDGVVFRESPADASDYAPLFGRRLRVPRDGDVPAGVGGGDDQLAGATLRMNPKELKDARRELAEMTKFRAELDSLLPAGLPVLQNFVENPEGLEKAYPAIKKLSKEQKAELLAALVRHKENEDFFDEHIAELRKRIRIAEQLEAPLPGGRERYGQLVDQPWKTPWKVPLSTFSADVDTASYSNVRRLLQGHAVVPPDAVRIEECINYFDYQYAPPAKDKESPFAVHTELARCPWTPQHHLVKIGLKGKELHRNERPPSNLVFLIDVSGSMQPANKLPLLVESMKVLVEELDERDRVGIVVYAGSAGTLLEPTQVVGEGRGRILTVLDQLSAGGSTAGAAGIRGAYELAAKHFVKQGVNRVILATDGDFNVGISDRNQLVNLVKEQAAGGIFLSVLGFGSGNINDAMLEAITNDGNGNYSYIDNQREGRKVFLQQLAGTLVTIAKDVKIQVEFNPGKVAAYRLIGYANRILRDEDFNNDKVDAGDIGAGHTVTALYEIVPAGVKAPNLDAIDQLKYQRPAGREAVDSPEWMTIKLRYKKPDGDQSTLLALPLEGEAVDWKEASGDFQFAAGVALFGEKLRNSDKIGEAKWKLVEDLAKAGSRRDAHGHRAEFLKLVGLAGRNAEIEAEKREGLEAPAAP